MQVGTFLKVALSRVEYLSCYLSCYKAFKEFSNLSSLSQIFTHFEICELIYQVNVVDLYENPNIFADVFYGWSLTLFLDIFTILTLILHCSYTVLTLFLDIFSIFLRYFRHVLKTFLHLSNEDRRYWIQDFWRKLNKRPPIKGC